MKLIMKIGINYLSVKKGEKEQVSALLHFLRMLYTLYLFLKKGNSKAFTFIKSMLLQTN